MTRSSSLMKRCSLLMTSALILSACGNVNFHALDKNQKSTEPGATGNGGDGTGGGGGGGGGGTVTDPTASPSPGTTPVPGTTPRNVTYTSVVPAKPNQVDILLVIDDSGSMKTDQLKLASKLSGFASQLESANVGMDWQMCVTVTRNQLISSQYYWGASVNWEGYTGSPRYILKKGTTNLNDIFTKTINAIGAGVPGSGDERGIFATHYHFYNGEPGVTGASGCYRKGAAVAVIVISDEDERSVGGDCTRVKTNMNEDPATCRALEPKDLPSNLLTHARSTFGPDVRFTFNSIVVKDAACEKIQDETLDEKNERAPSHLGSKYIEMSNLTNGGVGSICDSDFSTNLNLFKDKIVNSISSVTLECAPISGSLTVTVDGAATTAYTLSGATLKFNTAVNEGQTLSLTYKCN